MNEIQASRLVHDRYRLRFSQLLHKLNRSIVGNAACRVSKACGACRTNQGEMRGPLKEQIQNAINRALKETIGSNNQAAYINVGGRRRNRKKKKNNKKNNGVSGSAWSILNFQVDEPPARCRIDSIDRPPKVKGGGSPQVTKAKKTCKELKARLSPPRSCVKDTLEADDKPLIGNEAAEDENEAASAAQADQENIDPSNMPLSSLFKTTKGKKSKSKKGKDKDKDANDTNVTDDATSKQDAKAEEQTPTAVSPEASDVIVTSLSDEVIKAEVTTEKMAEEVEGVKEEVEDVKKDLSVEQAQATMSDTKTDTMTADDQNSAAVLYTTDTRAAVSMTPGEGPQLSPPEGGEGGGGGVVVEGQPAKADGSLPPESAGREKQSLLHDHNPEGMVCCTIL